MKLHNGILNKRKEFLTDESITNPFVLDDNLKRQKKQPKFVRNLGSTEDDMYMAEGDFQKMQKMMIGCRKFHSAPENAFEPPACSHVHHQNPYSMLGPFKMELASKEPHIVMFQIMT